MSTYKAYEAIASAWSAASLDTYITGGLWKDEAKPEVTWPYAVLTGIGNPAAMYDSDGQVRDHNFQISVFYKANGSTSPGAAAGALIDRVINAMESATFSLGGSGSALYCRRTRDDVRKDEHQRDVWIGDADFKMRRTQ